MVAASCTNTEMAKLYLQILNAHSGKHQPYTNTTDPTMTTYVKVVQVEMMAEFVLGQVS